MGMVTEWIFTKGKKTEAQRTRITFTDEEPDKIDEEKMRNLAAALIKIGKRLRAEERAILKEIEVTQSEDKDGGSNIKEYK